MIYRSATKTSIATLKLTTVTSIKHTLTFLTAILLAFAARAAEHDRIPPKIVFVLADDLGWAELDKEASRQLHARHPSWKCRFP